MRWTQSRSLLRCLLYVPSLGLTLWAFAPTSQAEPYLAVRMGLKCMSCHVNPTGGGLRNDYGMAFATTVLPAEPAKDTSIWNGRISDLIRVGGDLRASASDTQPTQGRARHQTQLDQMRLYADLSLIPQRLGIYVDQQVAPGSGETMEAYVRYGDAARGWYLKGGKFYLPFGWRLQDSTSDVRIVSGINMAIPDTGVEVGFETPQWSGQLDLTNGVSGVPQITPSYRTTGQLMWVQSRWRLGAAASFTRADPGNRRQGGVFAGLRTGPVVWLGEVDLVHDTGFPAGANKFLATLAEANWEIRRGHNLKLTTEYLDPSRDVSGDGQRRWSILYELTPLPFVQLRAGWRSYEDVPESTLQVRHLTFLELHGFF